MKITNHHFTGNDVSSCSTGIGGGELCGQPLENHEKRTVTPKYTITAEQCRQNALMCANAQDALHFVDGDASKPGMYLAAVGTMWATIGQLCCALGDPDNPNSRTNYNINVNNPVFNDPANDVRLMNQLQTRGFPT